MTAFTTFDRRRFLAGSAAFGAVAMFPLLGSAKTAEAGTTTAWTALQALADRYTAEKKVAGMVIGLGLNGDAPVYLNSGTLGFEREAIADAASVWRIYSMTKPITGTLAAMLIDEGKMGIDQPIADFIPAFASMRVATNPAASDSRPVKTPITVRHLLTHTAGLAYHFQPGAVAKAYRTKGLMPGLRTLGRETGDGDAPPSLQAFAETAASLPLVAEPGTVWHYSISIDVLGAVIERAAGAPFEALLKTRIFDAVGMPDTGFSVAGNDMGRFATNYALQNGKLVPIDIPPRTEYAAPAAYPSGGGGLVSTADDYLRFMRMISDRGQVGTRQVMSDGAASLVVSNLLPEGVAYEGIQGFGAGGRVVTTAAPGQLVGSYGWGGAAGTLASTLPARRFSVVLMTQYMPQQGYPLPAELAGAIAKDLAV